MNVFLASFFFAAIFAKTPEPDFDGIRTIPVSKTLESSTVMLSIAVPKSGQVVSSPVWVQFRIDGYALGAPSQFERADEIAQTKMGQTVHVVVDNQPYFAINEPALDPFDEGGFYYDMSYKFQLPCCLEEGVHTLRMFPARSFGESLKGDKVFAAMNFYVGEKSGKAGPDLSQPFITYNEPSDQMKLVEDKPILLDFFVSNANLSSDGYKVRLSIDGKLNRIITSWVPYYIFGLKKGTHTIKLELIDGTGAVVPGDFGSAEQTIRVS